MTTVYVLIMIISGSSGAATIGTAEFNQQITCQAAANDFEKVMANSWKGRAAFCVQK